MKTNKKKSRRGYAAAGRVPLAKAKESLSRYVREVQTRGRPITITQHGRDAAVLAPTAVGPRPLLSVREPLDARPLGQLELTPLPGSGATDEAIQRVVDEERQE